LERSFSYFSRVLPWLERSRGKGILVDQVLFALIELPASVAAKEVVDFVITEEKVKVIAQIATVFEGGKFFYQFLVSLDLLYEF